MTKPNDSRPGSIPPSNWRRFLAIVPRSCVVLVFLAWAIEPLWGQANNSSGSQPAQDSSAPGPASPPGPQILSVSAYAAYYSHGLAETGSALSANSANLPSDVGAGGSIAFDWSKYTERTTFSLSYTPSYTAQIRNSSLDALNHAFSFNVSRKLTPRCSLGFSAGANYSTLEESLFAPTSLSSAVSVPSNFSQFSGALLSGNFNNNQQLGVALTNSPLVESPIANLLYGQRVFTSSARGTLSYSLSPRLSLTFTGGGSRTQYASPNQPSTASTAAVVPNTTSGTASAALSYSLSPVTQVGATLSTSRVDSSLEVVYTTTSLATFGRSFGRQWIVQLRGGLGVTSPVHQTSSMVATRPLPAGGGTLAFKTGTSTILGSFDRSVSDPYGLGASTTSTASISWQWRRPGSLWSVQSSFSWQQLQGNALANTSGLRATAGLNRAFGPHFALLWQYTYLNYSGGLQTSPYSLSESAVRISTVWTPRPSGMR